MNTTKDAYKTVWFRLDNSAMIYPMVRTLSAQSIFRIGAEFYDEINTDILANALNKTYERYPYFKVELQMGMFRPYFITNTRAPFAEESDGCLLNRIDFYKNHGYLIRVTYYKKKLFIDFFHGLSDGLGAMEFLKTLIYYYVFEKYGETPDEDKIKTLKKPYTEGEIEDGFRKYHTAIDFKKGFNIMAGGLALPIKGTHFKKEGLGLIQGSVNTSELLKLSKSKNCSLTVFLSALALFSVANVQKCDIKSKKNYKVFIPVNLRKFYPSETLFNFTTLAKCEINPNLTPLDLDVYIEEVKTQLAKRLQKEEMDLKINFTSLMDKNPVLRFTPLAIKAAMAKLGRAFTGGSKQTMIVSNLGRVDSPECFNKHVKEIFFNQNCNNKTPDNIGIVSYKDRTVIAFSRAIKETDIEQFYFSYLARYGIEVEVISNFREKKNAVR